MVHSQIIYKLFIDFLARIWYNVYVINRKELRKLKIDHRINYRLVIDTETAPMDYNDTKVNPASMLVYDVGYSIVDKWGKVYLSRSFINADIFLNEKALMTSAYYADKIPNYWRDIKAGTRTLTNFATIKRTLWEDITLFGVKEVYAHNARFDYGALNATTRWLTKSTIRYFFPYGVTICDTLKMSRDVLGAMPTYRKFCKKHNRLTKGGKPRYTAEVIYQYITKNPDFVESHTALEDVTIEKEILAYCFRQHKKMRRALWE